MLICGGFKLGGGTFIGGSPATEGGGDSVDQGVFV